MAEGYIDGATITSALTYLNLGRRASRPLWHQTSILETTYLLLDSNIHVIPRPQGTGGERGDYAVPASEFSGLMVDSDRRRAIFKATIQSADESYDLVKAAWEQSEQDEDFKAWADVQRRDRWKNQTLVYGGLFDAVFIPYISKASGFKERDVQRILKESVDPKNVQYWAKHIESLEAAQIANAGWVIGGFYRGIYYDNLASVEDWQLLTHPFRKLAKQPQEVTEQGEVTSSAEALVKILIANALTESTKKLRVHTWAKTVKKARDYIKERKPQLPNVPHPEAVEIATQIARKIDVQGGPSYLRSLIDYSLGWGVPIGFTLLNGFTLEPWIIRPAMYIFKKYTNTTPGELMANAVLHSEYRFRWLENSIPGRIDRTLPSAPSSRQSD